MTGTPTFPHFLSHVLPVSFFFFLSIFVVVVVAISWAASAAYGGSRLGVESEL